MTQPHLADEAQSRTPTHHLTLRFSSTRHGARLARQLAVQQFTEWTGLSYDSDPARTVALVTAELAANAIRHGSLPSRDFRLVLLLLPHTLRIEVTDTRPERPPARPSAPSSDETSGRGTAPRRGLRRTLAMGSPRRVHEDGLGGGADPPRGLKRRAQLAA
ncbi:regulatory protein [Streptomyces hygroscopicus subsp. jinggangensis 5008]|nr:regulatory protein [Streptomyces hygroscopicus subsp. jinggangensis 5008]AGF67233.1 regulatory protein [Streptomyces hygroscopicus subsp. jinggangensis TL01]